MPQLKRDVAPPPPPPTATFTFTGVSTPTPLPPSASHPGGGCVSDEGVTYQCVPPGPPPTTIPVSPATVGECVSVD